MPSLPRRLANLVRLEHSLFALPYAVVGALLAADGLPPIVEVLWVGVAMVAARTLAMGLNRLIDAEVDARNPRTAKREIPVDPDVGWPPPPLEPWVTAPAIAGEGQWNAKEDVGFFRNQPNGTPNAKHCQSSSLIFSLSRAHCPFTWGNNSRNRHTLSVFEGSKRYGNALFFSLFRSLRCRLHARLTSSHASTRPATTSFA